MDFIDTIILLSAHIYAWYKLILEIKYKNENGEKNNKNDMDKNDKS